jgi:hypothetical protein
MSDSDNYSDSEGSDSSSEGSGSHSASSEGAGRRRQRGPTHGATTADPYAGMTLAERLKRMEAEKDARARGDGIDMHSTRKSSLKRKRERGSDSDSGESAEEAKIGEGRGTKSKKSSHKNAPAEMPSNRPVSRYFDRWLALQLLLNECRVFLFRWRQDPNLKQNKFRDPRYPNYVNSQICYIIYSYFFDAFVIPSKFRFSEISGKFDPDKFYDAYSFLDKYQVRLCLHISTNRFRGLTSLLNYSYLYFFRRTM